MLFLLYLVVRALVRLLVSGGQRGRDDASKDLENPSVGSSPPFELRKTCHVVVAIRPGSSSSTNRRDTGMAAVSMASAAA